MDRRVLGLPARAASSSCPIDYRASPDFLARVAAIVARPADRGRPGRAAVQPTPAARAGVEAARARLDGRTSSPRPRSPAVAITRDDVAEIIFTSGATVGAQGRRHHPPQRAREHRSRRARDPEVPEVGQALLSAPVPEPAAAQPHVRPGDGDLHPADAAGHRDLHARLQPGRDRRADQEATRLGARVGAEDSRRAEGARAARSRRIRRVRRTEAARREALVALPQDPSRLRPEVLVVRRRRGAARRRARSVLGRARLRRDPGLRPDRNRADRHAEPSVRHQEGIGRQGDRRRRGEDRRRRRDPGARRQRDARATSTPTRRTRARSRTAGSTPATSARSAKTGSSTSAAARRK